MSTCHCIKKDGQQCTRPVSNKLGLNPLFCYQHQNCAKTMEIKAPSEVKYASYPVPPAPIKSEFSPIVTNNRAISLIDKFIKFVTSVNYANECYNWELAGKQIKEKLMIQYEKLQRSTNIDTIYLSDGWDPLVNYCIGFDLMKYLDNHNDIYEKMIDNDTIFNQMYAAYIELIKNLYLIKFPKFD